MNVLVCSHLLRDIEQVCDEAVIMKDGAIVHHCNLEEERRSNRSFVELEVTGDDRQPARRRCRRSAPRACPKARGRWRIVLPPGVEVEAIWGLAARQNLLVRKLTHRRDTLEEIFLKAMGHLAHTPGEGAAARRGSRTLTAQLRVTHGGLQAGISAIRGTPHGTLDAVHGPAPLRLAAALSAAAGPPAHDGGVRVAAPVRRLRLSHESCGAAAGARTGVSRSSSRSTAGSSRSSCTSRRAFAVFLAALAGPGLVAPDLANNALPAVLQPAAHALELRPGAADGDRRHAVGRHVDSGPAPVRAAGRPGRRLVVPARTGRWVPAWSPGSFSGCWS